MKASKMADLKKRTTNEQKTPKPPPKHTQTHTETKSKNPPIKKPHKQKKKGWQFLTTVVSQNDRFFSYQNPYYQM